MVERCKHCLLYTKSYQMVYLCTLTLYGFSTLQSVRVFVFAQVIDVIAQITGAVHPLCNHHLFTHKVCLRKIHSCLQKHIQTSTSLLKCICVENTFTPIQEPLIDTNSQNQSPVINVAGYLHVDQELLKISGRHDNRCVQVDDIACLQIHVEVSSQILTAQNDTQKTFRTRGYSHRNIQIFQLIKQNIQD